MKAASNAAGILLLLLIAAMAFRGFLYWQRSDTHGLVAWEPEGGPVDLGAGRSLPRAQALTTALNAASCPSPISVEFVPASPYDADPSSVGSPKPGDSVAYVYRGWTFGERLGPLELNAAFFARRAYSLLTMTKHPAIDDLAVKIIVPAGCPTAAEEVMEALRLRGVER